MQERGGQKHENKNNNHNLIQPDAPVPLHARSCVWRLRTRLAAQRACQQACGRSSAGKGNLGVQGEVSG